MQERRNFSALAIELCLSCINPSKWSMISESVKFCIRTRKLFTCSHHLACRQTPVAGILHMSSRWALTGPCPLADSQETSQTHLQGISPGQPCVYGGHIGIPKPFHKQLRNSYIRCRVTEIWSHRIHHWKSGHNLAPCGCQSICPTGSSTSNKSQHAPW